LGDLLQQAHFFIGLIASHYFFFAQHPFFVAAFFLVAFFLVAIIVHPLSFQVGRYLSTAPGMQSRKHLEAAINILRL